MKVSGYIILKVGYCILISRRQLIAANLWLTEPLLQPRFSCKGKLTDVKLLFSESLSLI